MTRDEDAALIDLIRAANPFPNPGPAPLTKKQSILRDRIMREQDRRAGRAGRAIPLLIVSGLLLTAGAGTATIAMSHWSGVSMPAENLRNTAPIPVSWTTASGHTENCGVWIEFRNPDATDLDALDHAIKSRDWSGLGQQLYDTNIAADGGGDGEQRVAEGLGIRVREFADEVFPASDGSQMGETLAGRRSRPGG